MELFISFKDLTLFVDVCNTFVFNKTEAERNHCSKFLAYKTRHNQAINKCLQLILDTYESQKVEEILIATLTIAHFHKGNWTERFRKLLCLFESYLSEEQIPDDAVEVTQEGLVFRPVGKKN